MEYHLEHTQNTEKLYQSNRIIFDLLFILLNIF